MKNHTKRIAYVGIGCVAVALAVLGVFVPGLPTTVFVLVALWAFSQSSERLHAWLLRVPILKGAVIQAHQFQKHKALPIGVKMIAQVFAWSSFVLVCVTLESVIPKACVAAAALSCSIFMLRIPTLKG